MVEVEEAVLEERESIEAEEYRYLLQRLQADFVNYKRRVECEREEQARYANADLILKLLPVLDDFGQALNSIPDEAADTDWVEGIALVERKLRAILAEEGLSRIDAEGKEFDPWEHEAVFTEETGADEREGKVTSVIRDGYKLNGKMIRPAQVAVSKNSRKHEEPVTRQKITVKRRY